ncbi:hypothetical protein N7447_003343 [Penicillium robsamsonii]|uniref:uncharacterized protein n=1 Tax=Penicillium robsamsonii TaxID=1792511 RepID=UPI002549A0C1|nr:uncharacterized protein N7447_003343 [Penicillium robsamsonii]KAJ5826580.1 hypothetical protein N7447_003343 [Penicillium robsamsonii]
MDEFYRPISLERSRLYRSFPAAQGNYEGRQESPIRLPQTEGTQSDHIIFIVHLVTFAHDFLDLSADLPFRDIIFFNPKKSPPCREDACIGARASRSRKEAWWGPRRPPRRAPKRPSVVLEVTSSETPDKLRRDAHYWVDPAKGQANMAFTVSA